MAATWTRLSSLASVVATPLQVTWTIGDTTMTADLHLEARVESIGTSQRLWVEISMLFVSTVTWDLGHYHWTRSLSKGGWRMVSKQTTSGTFARVPLVPYKYPYVVKSQLVEQNYPFLINDACTI